MASTCAYESAVNGQPVFIIRNELGWMVRDHLTGDGWWLKGKGWDSWLQPIRQEDTDEETLRIDQSLMPLIFRDPKEAEAAIRSYEQQHCEAVELLDATLAACDIAKSSCSALREWLLQHPEIAGFLHSLLEKAGQLANTNPGNERFGIALKSDEGDLKLAIWLPDPHKELGEEVQEFSELVWYEWLHRSV